MNVKELTDDLQFGQVPGGSYSAFEQLTGFFKLLGSARAYNDLLPSGPWESAAGAAAPDLEQYTIAGIGLSRRAFNGSTTEERWSNSYEILHTVALGQTSFPCHLHGRPSTNTAGVVKFFIDAIFDKANPNGTVTPVLPVALATVSGTCTIPANAQFAHFVFDIGTLDLSGVTYGVGDKITLTLRRTPSDPQDTYPDDFIFEQCAFHVLHDTAGSRAPYIK